MIYYAAIYMKNGNILLKPHKEEGEALKCCQLAYADKKHGSEVAKTTVVEGGRPFYLKK